MTSCLTCKYLDEPDQPHKYHRCLWMASNSIPLCACDSMDVINIQRPLENCPTWEKREDTK